ncbi:MAG: DinB family protein [Chloroflexi bacterium]|nr:DinB family protein [Chloroflexota bacterium]
MGLSRFVHRVPPRAATELIGGIDEARAGLIAFLRSKDAQALAERPPSGEWSVIENVRHLLFAEQLHVGKFLPNGFEWNRVGLSGRTGKRYAEAGKDATDDLRGSPPGLGNGSSTDSRSGQGRR